MLAGHGVALEIDLEPLNMLGMLGLVKAGAGLTIVSESMIVRPAGVVMRAIVGCEKAIETIAFWPRPTEAALRDFLDVLVELRRHPT